MRRLAATPFVCVALCPAESKGTAEDEIAIRKVLSDVTEAFNRHEGKLTPTAYSGDYDAVILNGVRIPGKPDMRVLLCAA
jgi:hypothetical protein